MKLSDGGGSCLIAVGSIVPEFTVNVVACILMTSDSAILGLSTVIGSGCFDFTICLGIAAFVAYFSSKSLPIDMTDLYVIYVWYLASLLMLIIITIDGKVSRLEALMLLGLTPAYLYYNFQSNRKSNADYDTVKGDHDILPSPTTLFTNQYMKAIHQVIYKALKLVVPDYTGEMWQIVLGFTMTILTSFAITRATVFLIVRVLCHMSIPQSLVGLTIMSWGNNIGDIMNSAIAARRGNAQLSVSCVISTQVLNIHCSLGLPWVISTILSGTIHIEDSLTLNSLLFVMLIVVLSVLLIYIGGTALNLSVALLLTGLYVGYIICEWTVMREMTAFLS